MFKQRRSCYCAFCKTPRKVYKHKNLSYFEVLSLIFLSIIFTFVIYKSMDPRGLFIVAAFLLFGEIFTQVKWRSAMVCQNCGFDPVLYIRDHELAGLKIKAFLEKRPNSASHLLRPPIVLPKVKAVPSKQAVPMNSGGKPAAPFNSSAKPPVQSRNLSLKV